ncbi:MAG: NAD(P)-dependent oxidoreductase [Pseudomonadota bacterium]
MKVGVLGCGAMGGAMALRLAETGEAPACWDASEAARARMAAAGLTVAASAEALAGASDLLILSLPHAEAVRAAMAEASGALRNGAAVLDTSTSEPAVSQALAAQGAAEGWVFLDGPVSGGPAGARGGTMTMLLGGDEAAAARLAPVLDRLTGKRVHVGGSGAGHAAKIANNMLCAANLALVAEAVRLGEAAGVPAEKLLEGVNAGSGRSAVSEVNFPRWVLSGAYDSGFTMGLMRKDVRLAEALGAASGVAMPAFEGIARVWADSAARLADAADFNEIARPGAAAEEPNA